jgi:hypothetical protein
VFKFRKKMLQKAKFIIYVFKQFTQEPKEVLVRVASGPRAVCFQSCPTAWNEWIALRTMKLERM